MVSVMVSNGILEYKNSDLVLLTAVSNKLLDIIRVKEFDLGYMVVDAKYPHGIVEEYIDLEDALCMLGLYKLKEDYFSGVKEEDICLRKQ